MTHIGFFLMNPSAWNALAYSVCYTAQIGRILAEERLLTADSKYRDFADRVRYRVSSKRRQGAKGTRGGDIWSGGFREKCDYLPMSAMGRKEPRPSA